MGKEPAGRPSGQPRGASGNAPAASAPPRVVKQGTLKAPINAPHEVGGRERKPLDRKALVPPITIAACAAMVAVGWMGRGWAVVPVGLGFFVFGQSLLGAGEEQRREKVLRWALGVALVVFLAGMIVADQLGRRMGIAESDWAGAAGTRAVAPAAGESAE